MATHRVQGDTLLTQWNPPENLSEKLGEFVLTFIDDKIVYAEARDDKGKIMAKSFYRNHLKHGAVYLPLEIKTIRYAESDSTVENVTYSNPKFDKKISKEITNFQIPPNVKVEEIEW
jgi:hypothetical protein